MRDFVHAGHSFVGTCGCGAGAPPCKGCLAYGKSFLREGARFLFMRVIHSSERADAELACRPARVVWLTGFFLREGARFFHAGHSFLGTCVCGAGAPPCKGCLAYGKSFFKGRCAIFVHGLFVFRNVRMRSWRSALQRLFGLREIFFKGRCAPRTGARLLQRSRTQNGKRLASAHACYDKAELRTEKDLQARTPATTKPNSERKKTCKRARLLRRSRT